MPRYSVEVSRINRDIQWRTIVVEAESEAAAKGQALLAADADATFWNAAKTYPIESEEPLADGFVYTVEDTMS